jgi:hypothetical protein
MGEQLPAHGPGCRPLTGLRSARFPDEPRYICAANCPRRQALAREVCAIRPPRTWKSLTRGSTPTAWSEPASRRPGATAGVSANGPRGWRGPTAGETIVETSGIVVGVLMLASLVDDRFVCIGTHV